MIYKPTLAYRVWSDDNNVWAEDKSYICPMGTLYFWERDYIEPARGNYTIEQCTGQKDKNGKMIYEGDILSFTVFDYNDYDTQYTGVVVYHGSRYTIWNNPDSEYYGSDGGFDLDWVIGQDCEIEIIGNIHENPELLEAEE